MRAATKQQPAKDSNNNNNKNDTQIILNERKIKNIKCAKSSNENDRNKLK